MLTLDAVSHLAPAPACRFAACRSRVRGGEILGIAGVSGNGQRALADVIAGLLQPDAGAMTIAGRQVSRLFAARGAGARTGPQCRKTA